MYPAPTVFVVDDELAVRHSLRFLLATAGYRAEVFPSAEEFLNRCGKGRRGCLLLDVRMEGMTGLELQEHLSERGGNLPVIIMSGYANTPVVVRAMRNGAVDFLEKPFDDDVLLGKISEAIDRDRAQWSADRKRRMVEDRISWLSPREKEVMDLLIAGKTTKEIASQLGISTKTVDVHRARLLDKMQVGNAVELANLLSEFVY